MEELGRVIETQEMMAKVSITPKGLCGKCGAAAFCSALNMGGRVVEVHNPLRAEKGDIVKIDVPPKVGVLSAFFVFIMPILLFFLGMGIGGEIGDQTSTIIGGIIGLGVGLAILKILDKRLKKGERFRPQIVEICAISIAIDPVCGMRISPKETKSSYNFAGKTYYFCSEACLERFKKNPERYL